MNLISQNNIIIIVVSGIRHPLLDRSLPIYRNAKTGLQFVNIDTKLCTVKSRNVKLTRQYSINRDSITSVVKKIF